MSRHVVEVSDGQILVDGRLVGNLVSNLPYVVERDVVEALCGEDEDEIEDARRDGFSDGYNEALQDVTEEDSGALVSVEKRRARAKKVAEEEEATA